MIIYTLTINGVMYLILLDFDHYIEEKKRDKIMHMTFFKL